MLSRPMTSKSISHDIQAQHEHVSSSFSQSREPFANGSFCPILFKITLRILRQISTRLRLNSEFWAEGSSLGFHVATCKTGVFTHQYSSVWEIRIFNTIGRSLPVMVTKRAGQNAITWSSGGQFRIQKNSEGAGGGAKIPRLKLINLSGRSRYFVQFTDEVFGS